MRAAVPTGWRQPPDLCGVPDPGCPGDGVVLRAVLRAPACGVRRPDAFAAVRLARIPGHECCGVVEDAGPRVTRRRRGDRVIGVIAPLILACGRCPGLRAGRADGLPAAGDPRWNPVPVSARTPPSPQPVRDSP